MVFVGTKWYGKSQINTISMYLSVPMILYKYGA
jgi:hypothetical protein